MTTTLDHIAAYNVLGEKNFVHLMEANKNANCVKLMVYLARLLERHGCIHRWTLNSEEGPDVFVVQLKSRNAATLIMMNTISMLDATNALKQVCHAGLE